MVMTTGLTMVEANSVDPADSRRCGDSSVGYQGRIKKAAASAGCGLSRHERQSVVDRQVGGWRVEFLANGLLRPVLTGWNLPTDEIWAVPTGGRLISPAVNSIMSFIEASIRRSTPTGSEDE